jgi:RNA polymerase sigma-70 factor (ECF subfamily)
MRDRLIFDEDVVAAMAQDTETVAAELEERRQALGNCLEKLPTEQRDILQAHYLTGRTVREIAEATQRSESGVKMILLRLREQLSDCIQRQIHPSA